MVTSALEADWNSLLRVVTICDSVPSREFTIGGVAAITDSLPCPSPGCMPFLTLFLFSETRLYDLLVLSTTEVLHLSDLVPAQRNEMHLSPGFRCITPKFILRRRRIDASSRNCVFSAYNAFAGSIWYIAAVLVAVLLRAVFGVLVGMGVLVGVVMSVVVAVVLGVVLRVVLRMDAGMIVDMVLDMAAGVLVCVVVGGVVGVDVYVLLRVVVCVVLGVDVCVLVRVVVGELVRVVVRCLCVWWWV